MKTAAIVIYLVLIANIAQAFTKEEYCALKDNPDYFRSKALIESNHLAFNNSGGLLNGGVCWWHSLFQRSAFYLTVFNPNQAKPNFEQVRKIISNIILAKSIVEIPGYSDMTTFSSHWQLEIQKQLEHWQRVDGFLRQRWISNLKSKTEIPPRELELRMDGLFHEVENKKHVAWVMLKLSGIRAHAWLVVSMKIMANGYELTIIDSNNSRFQQTAYYFRGSDSLQTQYGKTVPYLDRSGDFPKFKDAGEKYCSRNLDL